MSPTDSAQRNLRRHIILRRWSRFGWDSFGRPLLQVWTASYLALGIGLSALFASMLLEGYWRRIVPETNHITPDFILTPSGGTILLSVLLMGAWLADRYFELVTPPGAKPPRWLRMLRLLILTIPVIGILVSLALYRFQREPRISHRVPALLSLFPENLRRLGLPGRPQKLNHFLRAKGQQFWAICLWISAFQMLPFLAALDLLGWQARSNAFFHGLAGFLCILFRIVALGAFLVFIKERKTELQMESREMVAIGVVLLASLTKFPYSLAAMLALPFLSEKTKVLAAEPTALGTIYKKRFRSRALRNELPASLVTEEIRGSQDGRRSRFYTLKLSLLALEVAALTWLLAPPLSDFFWSGLVVFCLCSWIPGLLIWALKFSGHLLFRGPGLSVPASLHDCTFLLIVPSVVSSALILGSLAKVGNPENWENFWLAMAYQGVGITVAVGTLRGLPVLLTRSPDPSTSGAAFGMPLSLSFVIIGGLLGAPKLGPPLLLMARDLCVPLLFASPLAALTLSHWLLPPFRLRHLVDRRVPGRIRAVLAAFAVPAILPLGGLAVPAWIFLHHILGGELNREAARLRGYD